MRRRAVYLIAGICVFLVASAGFFRALAPDRPIAGIRIERAFAPDPDDKPLELLIWYPENLAQGARHPLVVFSHGAGGSLSGHRDTAIALARAGFIVAAMNHTGDNYRDDSYAGSVLQLTVRPRHISRTIDFMLDDWSQRLLIDPDHVGMFGHSVGGFTALVIAGAEPDLSRSAVYCSDKPSAWTCNYLQSHGFSLEDLGEQRPQNWAHDPRVKAAVIAAPAIGYSLNIDTLGNVRIPIQLWAAEDDRVVDDSPTTIRQALPVKPEFYSVSGAGHFSFLEPCNWAMHSMIAAMSLSGTEAICSDPNGFNRARFHQELNTSVTGFFEANIS